MYFREIIGAGCRGNITVARSRSAGATFECRFERYQSLANTFVQLPGFAASGLIDREYRQYSRVFRERRAP